MLPVTASTLRLFIHITAAAAWLAALAGLAYLQPRISDADATVARLADGLAGWAGAAFVVATATGVWNTFAVEPALTDDRYGATLLAKLGLAALSAVLVYASRRTRSPRRAGRAAAAAATLASGALFLGVLLAAA